MADISEKPRPGSLLVSRIHADESRYVRIGPHREASRQIVTAVTAKTQPWSVDHGNCKCDAALHSRDSKGTDRGDQPRGRRPRTK